MKTGVRVVIGAWATSRAMLVLIAVIAVQTQGKSLDEVLGNWDVQHFLAIANNGYAVENDIAFFPGWPLLLKAISLTGLPVIITGAVLSAGLSLAAVAALYRMGGWGAAVAWILAPVGVFTLAPYTESLFCAAAFWAWERAGAKRWGQAAALAAVAASVRVSGLFLFGALVILALTQTLAIDDRLERWIARWKHVAWMLIPLGVILAYACFLYLERGSWSAWFDAQSAGWNREFTWPWDCLQHTFAAAAPGAYPDFPEWPWMFRGELVSFAVGLIVTAICLARKKLAEASWIGVQLLAFATSYWLLSVNRAVLLWFPLWTEVGRLANVRSTPARLGVMAAGALSLGAQWIWAWLFFVGSWAS
ncbi:MAG: hypothetical protein LBI99_10730 [Propionibacteriaceae bacterium]|jgi:hypothetical protein|nr:hypothetical protein [Propionibacteriaceae bacterium]